MSLILDSLKKINSAKKPSSSVPPSLLNLKPAGKKGNRIRKSLIVLLVVSVLGFISILLLPSTDSGYKINAADHVADITPAPPVPAPEPSPVVQPQQTPQQVKNPAVTSPEFDPTAANQQRLANMKSLPEINKPQQPTPVVPAPLPVQIPTFQTPMQETPTNPAEPQQTTAPTQTLESNPSFVLTGKAKKEYDKKIEYNTLTAQAAAALRSGKPKNAEEFYAKALAEKVTKPTLTGLLTAKIRQGKLNDIQGVIDTYSFSADASVVSAAAMEMAEMGYAEQALQLLHINSAKAGSGQIYYTAGVIQEESGDFEKAELAYQKAVLNSPADAYAVYAYARILDIQKKYDEAVKIYTRLANMQTAESGMKTSAKERATAIADYLKALAAKTD